jgi:hypothetical protein
VGAESAIGVACGDCCCVCCCLRDHAEEDEESGDG